MAFEFELGALSEVEWCATEYIVDFTVGYDLDTRERISMAVALIEDVDGSVEPFELTFGIMKSPIDGGDSDGPYFDHVTCRKYVSAENAAGVMTLILDAIRKLVDEVKPQSIQMATFEDDLPPAAMAKYYNITNMLGQCGFGMNQYRRGAADMKDYWLFAK